MSRANTAMPHANLVARFVLIVATGLLVAVPQASAGDKPGDNEALSLVDRPRYEPEVHADDELPFIDTDGLSEVAVRSAAQRLYSYRHDYEVARFRDTSTAGDVPGNIVFSLSMPALRGISACLDPADDLRATYSVGVVFHGTSIDQRPESLPLVPISDREFARRWMAERAPAPDYGDKPRVMVMVNQGTDRWAWHLGERWEDHRPRRDYLVDYLSALELDVDTGGDVLADQVCSLIDSIESFLDADEDELEAVASQLDVQNRAAAIERAVAGIEEKLDEHQAQQPAVLDLRLEAMVEEPLSDTARARRQAIVAVEENRLDDAHTAIEDAQHHLDELESAASAVISVLDEYQELTDRLDAHVEQAGLRTLALVPHGSELRDAIDTADGRVDDLRDGFADAVPAPELTRRHRDARQAVDELSELLSETETRFTIFATTAALMAILFLLLAAKLLYRFVLTITSLGTGR